MSESRFPSEPLAVSGLAVGEEEPLAVSESEEPVSAEAAPVAPTPVAPTPVARSPLSPPPPKGNHPHTFTVDHAEPLCDRFERVVVLLHSEHGEVLRLSYLRLDGHTSNPLYVMDFDRGAVLSRVPEYGPIFPLCLPKASSGVYHLIGASSSSSSDNDDDDDDDGKGWRDVGGGARPHEPGGNGGIAVYMRCDDYLRSMFMHVAGYVHGLDPVNLSIVQSIGCEDELENVHHDHWPLPQVNVAKKKRRKTIRKLENELKQVEATIKSLQDAATSTLKELHPSKQETVKRTWSQGLETVAEEEGEEAGGASADDTQMHNLIIEKATLKKEIQNLSAEIAEANDVASVVKRYVSSTIHQQRLMHMLLSQWILIKPVDEDDGEGDGGKYIPLQDIELDIRRVRSDDAASSLKCKLLHEEEDTAYVVTHVDGLCVMGNPKMALDMMTGDAADDERTMVHVVGEDRLSFSSPFVDTDEPIAAFQNSTVDLMKLSRTKCKLLGEYAGVPPDFVPEAELKAGIVKFIGDTIKSVEKMVKMKGEDVKKNEKDHEIDDDEDEDEDEDEGGTMGGAAPRTRGGAVAVRTRTRGGAVRTRRQGGAVRTRRRGGAVRTRRQGGRLKGRTTRVRRFSRRSAPSSAVNRGRHRLLRGGGERKNNVWQIGADVLFNDFSSGDYRHWKANIKRSVMLAERPYTKDEQFTRFRQRNNSSETSMRRSWCVREGEGKDQYRFYSHLQKEHDEDKVVVKAEAVDKKLRGSDRKMDGLNGVLEYVKESLAKDSSYRGSSAGALVTSLGSMAFIPAAATGVFAAGTAGIAGAAGAYLGSWIGSRIGSRWKQGTKDDEEHCIYLVPTPLDRFYPLGNDDEDTMITVKYPSTIMYKGGAANDPNMNMVNYNQMVTMLVEVKDQLRGYSFKNKVALEKWAGTDTNHFRSYLVAIKEAILGNTYPFAPGLVLLKDLTAKQVSMLRSKMHALLDIATIPTDIAMNPQIYVSSNVVQLQGKYRLEGEKYVREGSYADNVQMSTTLEFDKTSFRWYFKHHITNAGGGSAGEVNDLTWKFYQDVPASTLKKDKIGTPVDALERSLYPRHVRSLELEKTPAFQLAHGSRMAERTFQWVSGSQLQSADSKTLVLQTQKCKHKTCPRPVVDFRSGDKSLRSQYCERHARPGQYGGPGAGYLEWKGKRTTMRRINNEFMDSLNGTQTMTPFKDSDRNGTKLLPPESLLRIFACLQYVDPSHSA